MDHAAEVARNLLNIKAVQLNPQAPFTWASGILSPIYCDNRIALSHPVVRTLIKNGLAEASRAFDPFDLVAGVATAGIAHGALLADKLGKPFAYVRSSAKSHGRRNLIEGEVHAGQRVLVVEDLISTGGSCLAATEALQEAGCEVVGVLAIFQYEFDKARKAFSAQNLPFQTLSSYSVLIQEAISAGFINAADQKTLEQWRENPEAWGALYA